MADTSEPRDHDLTAPIGKRPEEGSDTADAAHGTAPDASGTSPSGAAPIAAGGTTPPAGQPEPIAEGRRGWRGRLRGAGRKTVLGGAAAALALLLLGGAGGFAIAQVSDGDRHGDRHGWADPAGDRDGDRDGGPGMRGGPGPGGMLPPALPGQDEDDDAPTT